MQHNTGERTAKPHCWQLCLGPPCSRYVDVGECRVGVVVISLPSHIQLKTTIDDSEHRRRVGASVIAGSHPCETQVAPGGLSAHLQQEGHAAEVSALCVG